MGISKINVMAVNRSKARQKLKTRIWGQPTHPTYAKPIGITSGKKRMYNVTLKF